MRDGAIADTTVAATPAPNASSIDPDDTTVFPSGSSNPRAEISALSSCATPIPIPSPTVAAIVPISAASTTTVAVTVG